MIARTRWTVAGSLVLIVLLTGCPQMEPGDVESGEPNELLTETPANSAPVADAGSDQTAVAGDLVVLDGTGSSDPDADRLAFIWRQVSGTPEVLLEDGFSSRPRFRAPDGLTGPVTLTFRLTVADGFAVAFDEVSVTIAP